jgi:hypothetical protein
VPWLVKEAWLAADAMVVDEGPGTGEDTSERSPSRQRLAVAAPIVAGVIAGALFGLRALDLWTRRPSSQQVPTAGLLYLGSLFLLGGLLSLNRSVWLWMHNGNVKAFKNLFGAPPAGDRRSPWLGALRGAQSWLVTREERERDSPQRQRTTAVLAIVAGAMIVGYALLH